MAQESNDYELRLYCDGVLIAVESNHVDFLSAELAGVEWVAQNREHNDFEVLQLS